MKVLLTGATGFLGKYVIEELKNNSYQVVAFGRNEKVGKTLMIYLKLLRIVQLLSMLLHFLLFGEDGKISIM